MSFLVDVLIVTIILAGNYMFWLATDVLYKTFKQICVTRCAFLEGTIAEFIIFTSLASLIIFYVVIFSAPAGMNRQLIMSLIGFSSIALIAYRVVCQRRLRLSLQIKPLFFASSMVFGLFLLRGVDFNLFASASQTWFSGSLTSDNVLPLLFVKGLIEEDKVVISPLLETWLSSDRPPVMASILLMYTSWISLLPNIPEIQSIKDQLINVIVFISSVNLNCLIFVPIWLVSNQLFKTKSFAKLTLLLLLTPFVLVNLVFTWPKMLAAAYCLLAIYYQTYRKPALTALCCILAFLTHGATVYIILPIVIWEFRNIFYHMAALPAYSCLLAPWEAYKHFIDPPGDRLLKYHIAGKRELNMDSSLDNIVSAYKSLTIDVFIENKIRNLVHLFPGNKFDIGWAQFFHLLPTLFLPALFFVIASLANSASNKMGRHEIHYWKLAATSLPLIVLVQYGSEHSVASLTHLSYATPIIILTTLCWRVSESKIFPIAALFFLLNLLIATNRINLNPATLGKIDINLPALFFLIIAMVFFFRAESKYKLY